MKKRIICLIICALIVLTTGCGKSAIEETTKATASTEPLTTAVTTTAETTASTTEATTESTTESTTTARDVPITALTANGEIKTIEKDFSISSYSGDYGFDDFIKEGGAKSDEELTNYLMTYVLTNKIDLLLGYMGGGCSTISAHDKNGNQYFGRNYDWNYCKSLIMISNPSSGYRSVSTVDMDYITSSAEYELTDDLIRLCALYLPLDGMNEKGLCVSVNMISDSSVIDQNTNKPDLTTTTAIRLLLNKASSTDQAVNMLKQYDVHSSKGIMVHFAISDASGKSVAVEYMGNVMKVVETPVMTNFYLADGAKHGVGSNQSHTRYNMLMKTLEEKETLNANEMREALSSVSKKNFGEFMSTEWSAVFDKTNKTVTYFHRENYTRGYIIKL